MVFFVCCKCNEGLRKKQVKQHFITCRPVDISCVDCLQKFTVQNYDLHNSCVSEQEKYDSMNFKKVVSKGVEKQNNWTSSAHSKLRNFRVPPGVPTLMKKKLLESTNIPRKKAKFENFLNTSFRFAKKCDIDALWLCITKEDKFDCSNGCTEECGDIGNLKAAEVETEVATQNNGDESNAVSLETSGIGETIEKSLLDKKLHKYFRKVVKSILILHKKPMKVKALRRKTFEAFMESKHYDSTLYPEKFLVRLFQMVVNNTRRFTLSEDKRKVSLVQLDV